MIYWKTGDAMLCRLILLRSGEMPPGGFLGIGENPGRPLGEILSVNLGEILGEIPQVHSLDFLRKGTKTAEEFLGEFSSEKGGGY